ncbi:MAG: hypothetical protein GYB68_03335 [Chloroflexi bacterium]|nr:hypothetical protein [Chloroflexota bacterium]
MAVELEVLPGERITIYRVSEDHESVTSVPEGLAATEALFRLVHGPVFHIIDLGGWTRSLPEAIRSLKRVMFDSRLMYDPRVNIVIVGDVEQPQRSDIGHIFSSRDAAIHYARRHIAMITYH